MSWSETTYLNGLAHPRCVSRRPPMCPPTPGRPYRRNHLIDSSRARSKLRTGRFSRVNPAQAAIPGRSVRSTPAVHSARIRRLRPGSALSGDRAACNRRNSTGKGPGEVGNPNDPAWSLEWGQRLTRASDLWQLTTGNPSIVIAVVDTGLAPIPDLTDVVSGWDIVGNTNSTPDDFGHGTWVSSVIGAAGDNGIGMAGYCWRCRSCRSALPRPAGSSRSCARRRHPLGGGSRRPHHQREPGEQRL